MDRKPLTALLLLVLVSLAGACSTSAVAEGPPDINYGRDVCFECGMIISETRFASAYRLADGTEKLFDDVGGMLKHGHASGEIGAAEAWVHDYTTEEWVAADQAYFIVTRSVMTPMAFGIVSFGDEGRALAFARDIDADVVDWATVLALPPDELRTIADHAEHGDPAPTDSNDHMDHNEEGPP
jgi:copper chaperone NosL